MPSEHEFMDGLRKRFDKKEWCLVPQVRNGTGFNTRTRTADAIAVSLWPSRGVDAHGFEFKDSRTDWLKELKQPEKSEEIGRYCAFWSLVVSDAGIVKSDELPSAWGLMVLDAEAGVKTVKKAPRREAQPPTWGFTAAVLKAASEVVADEAEIQRRIKLEVMKANSGVCQQVEDARRKERESAAKQTGEHLRLVRAFEEASGVRLDTWSTENNRRIGEAVKLVMSRGENELRDWLASMVKEFDRAKLQAEKALAELVSAKESEPCRA